MTTLCRFFTLLVGVSSLACLNGCGTPSAPPAPTGQTQGSDDHDHDAHAEDHQGPHDGMVVELGHNHEYHAELVEDETASTLTIYVLDKDLKELPIAAESITLNLTVDGTPSSFELAAVDPADGKTSKFAATGSDAFTALHEHHAAGKLNVTIDGTPHSGAVEHHDHDH